MKISLPEECEMDGLRNEQYPDLEKIRYEGDVQSHIDGATKNQNEFDFKKLQKIYKTMEFSTVVNDDVTSIPAIALIPINE